MRQMIWAICMALGLGIHVQAAPTTAPAGNTTKTSLKLVSLGDCPNVVNSKSDNDDSDEDEDFFFHFRIRKGIILPPTCVEFSRASQKTELMIGSEKLSLGWGKKNRFALLAGRREIALKPLIAGRNERHPNWESRETPLESVEIPLGKKQRYRLAFPRASFEDDRATLWYCNGGVQQAMIGQQSINFYDSDLDGQFVSGRDCFYVSRGDRKINLLAPISRYFSTKQGIYEIVNLAEDGSTLEYRKCPEKPVKLSVSFLTDECELQMVILSDGKKSKEQRGLNLVTAVGAKSTGPKAVDELLVLPGIYTIGPGLVYSTRLGRIVAAVSGANKPITVTADDPPKLELGGPFTLKFNVYREGNNKFYIERCRVVGSAGEIYTRFKWDRNCLPEICVTAGNNQLKIGKMEHTYGQSFTLPSGFGRGQEIQVSLAGIVEGLGMASGKATVPRPYRNP